MFPLLAYRRQLSQAELMHPLQRLSVAVAADGKAD